MVVGARERSRSEVVFGVVSDRHRVVERVRVARLHRAGHVDGAGGERRQAGAAVIDDGGHWSDGSLIDAVEGDVPEQRVRDVVLVERDGAGVGDRNRVVDGVAHLAQSVAVLGDRKVTELEAAEHLVLEASSDGLRGARLGHEGREAYGLRGKPGQVDPALEEGPVRERPRRAHVALRRVGPGCSLVVPVYRRAGGVVGRARGVSVTVSRSKYGLKGFVGAGVAVSCPHPLEDRESVDDATPGEVALDEEVPHCVLAAEPLAAICLRSDLSNLPLEEPEAHLGVAIIGIAVQAKVDDQVANVVLAGVDGVGVGGSVGVGDVIFVRHLLL